MKIVAIVGPTASGKTELALHIAQKLNGVLVNADSVQVYKRLDIISGKDVPLGSPFTPEKCADIQSHFSFGYYNVFTVPIYLLDLVGPFYEFSVADYISVARPTISHISKKGKLPIIVGGTTYYIKSLLEGVSTAHIPQDKKLREELSHYSVQDLQNKLYENDKKKFLSLNESDNKNPRRLIRAIEVLSSKLPLHISSSQYEVIYVGLECDQLALMSKIDERVEKRMRMGAIDEAKSLFDEYTHLSAQVKGANGYKELFSYFKGDISLDKAVERWKITEHQTAKKQKTFLKVNRKIKWFSYTKKNVNTEVIKYIQSLI